MPPKKETSLSVFVLDSKTEEDDKIVCNVWASKLAESDKGSYYNQEKWLKDDKASEKPIETTAKSSFTSFLASGTSFLVREAGQANDTFATGPAPYKNRTKDFFESLYCSERAASIKTPGSGVLSIFPGKCRTFGKCIE